MLLSGNIILWIIFDPLMFEVLKNWDGNKHKREVYILIICFLNSSFSSE